MGNVTRTLAIMTMKASCTVFVSDFQLTAFPYTSR